VTFLAFGNGSPDVFSTFSAMKANSGTLAIGELLGAAVFIVSVVVGSMCLVKPFKVDKGPFLRDVGFFMCAVVLHLAVLWDGKIRSWEAAMLVILYTFYVLVVVAGSWWERRMEKRRVKERLLRAEYAPDESGEETLSSLLRPYRDEPIEPYLDERK
jgi:sodium/potassium/calcium exchanger 6